MSKPRSKGTLKRIAETLEKNLKKMPKEKAIAIALEELHKEELTLQMLEDYRDGVLGADWT